MLIDVYAHITPQKYVDALSRSAPSNSMAADHARAYPTLVDLDTRFRIMDRYEDLVQVLSLGAPAVEAVADAKTAAELAQIANDEMADLVCKYPDRFASAVACVPMNDPDAALREIDRAIAQLGLRGIQIYSDANGKPLDSPEFMPIYEKMTHYDLPILLHPKVGTRVVVYHDEEQQKYLVPQLFAWAFQTTVAMAYLVGSGVFERLPTLKVIAHHCGAMVPYFAERISVIEDGWQMRMGYRHEQRLTKRLVDYYRMFYADTAIHGNTSALMCGYAFFGADNMLFGTDMPYDNQIGDRAIRQTILAVDNMNVADWEKKKIFEGNACRLLRLPV